MDPEGSMRPTYRHADLLGLSELVPTECGCVCVCVSNTGGRNVVGGCPVALSGQWRQRWGDSAGTRSDPYAGIVFAGRKCNAGQHQPLPSQ